MQMQLSPNHQIRARKPLTFLFLPLFSPLPRDQSLHKCGPYISQ